MTEPPKPVKVTGVEVIDGTTLMVVQAQGPVVLVVPADEVRTRVLEQDVTTVVERVGGSVVTNIVVITPSPGVLVAVVTTVGGTPMTIVNTPDPVSVVTMVDGIQRTVVRTPPPQTVVTMVGGVATTTRTIRGRPACYLQYGLGYFQNAQGREEYGIILMDESGRGLQARSRSREADSASDILDTHAAIAKGRHLGKHLPFMALRYPWRITFVLFQLAVLIFIIYYHAYYRGSIRDNGRLWLFLNTPTPLACASFPPPSG